MENENELRLAPGRLFILYHISDANLILKIYGLRHKTTERFHTRGR